MGIKVTGAEEVKDYIRKQAERLTEAYIGRLDMLAKDVVSAIRTSEVSYWVDHTGNLRSSIGYIIYRNGIKVREGGFEKFDGPNRDDAKEDGSKVGLSFAQELASKYKDGIVLVVVAGMEYAAYVEAIENRTVLAGGELLAKRLFNKLNAEFEARRK